MNNETDRRQFIDSVRSRGIDLVAKKLSGIVTIKSQSTSKYERVKNIIQSKESINFNGTPFGSAVVGFSVLKVPSLNELKYLVIFGHGKETKYNQGSLSDEKRFILESHSTGLSIIELRVDKKNDHINNIQLQNHSNFSHKVNKFSDAKIGKVLSLMATDWDTVLILSVDTSNKETICFSEYDPFRRTIVEYDGLDLKDALYFNVSMNIQKNIIITFSNGAQYVSSKSVHAKRIDLNKELLKSLIKQNDRNLKDFNMHINNEIPEKLNLNIDNINFELKNFENNSIFSAYF